MDVVIPILVHRVGHGNRRRALFIEIAETSACHHRLENVHVEPPRKRGFLKELLHLSINVAVVLLVFAVQFGIPLGQCGVLRCRFPFSLDSLFLLNGSKNTILIDVNGCNVLFLEEFDHITIQNGTTLDEDDIGVSVVNSTPKEHLRQQASDSKGF